jgi:hypothetical protein
MATVCTWVGDRPACFVAGGPGGALVDEVVTLVALDYVTSVSS